MSVPLFPILEHFSGCLLVRPLESQGRDGLGVGTEMQRTMVNTKNGKMCWQIEPNTHCHE